MSEKKPLGEIVSEELAPTARLLDEVAAFIRRFVVLTRAQVVALALWVLHTHVIAAADTTPYLVVTSAEKRSGKTRLLEVLELLVREPLQTANTSDAALFRTVAEREPTLLLDEVDAIFKSRDREDLRGLLNSGFRRGAVVLRMGGPKMTTLEQFPVFCAKAFAGIGQLPDTIEDRSIRIRLERKTRDEPTERFRRRDVAPGAESLRGLLVAWAESSVDSLHGRRPLLPEELDDRAQDVWEPLLAIAEAAGESWAARARATAAELSGAQAREDESLGVRLLRDIREIFDEQKTNRLASQSLMVLLNQLPEAPWGNWRGRPMTQQTLASFLKSFGIRSRTIWLGHGATAKGYLWEQFEPVWARYLDVETVTLGRQADVRTEPGPDATPDGLTAPDGGSHPARTREEEPPLRVGADRPVRPSGPAQEAGSQPSGQPSGGPLAEAALVPPELRPSAPAHRPLPAPNTDIRPLVALLRRDSMMSRRAAEAEIGQAIAWQDWTAAHVAYYKEISRPDLARIARP
jgi:hypothetical protein